MKIAPAVRIVLTIVGILIVIGAFAAVLFFGAMTNPPPLRIAVAIRDLNPGDRLAPEDYRIVDQIIEPGLARLYVNEDETPAYHGMMIVDTIRRGDPLNKVRLASPDSTGVRRYALVLTDSEQVIMTLPVNPNIIPSKISAGDRVNIIFTAGRDVSISQFPDPTREPPTPTPEPTQINADQQAQSPAPQLQPTPTPEGQIAATATPTVTPTPVIVLPLADLMLDHVEVLEVVYQQVQNPNYGLGGDSRPYIDGPMTAIVVRVPRSYQTVLTFAAAAGDLRFAVSSPAFNPAAESQPGAGVDWKAYAEAYRWKVMESLARGETLTQTLYPNYTPVAPPALP